jgi:hypothetical protein
MVKNANNLKQMLNFRLKFQVHILGSKRARGSLPARPTPGTNQVAIPVLSFG